MGLYRLGWWLCAAGAALAQISPGGGPAILSRYGALGASSTERTELLGIRPYLSLNGTWDSGYAPLSVDAQGRPVERDFYGGEATAGVYGFHNWRRTLLGVNYNAHFRHYAGAQKYDGVDQVLSLGVAHQATRRTAISLNQVAGSYARGMGLGLTMPGTGMDQSFFTAPGDELFDSRVHFVSSVADVTYQKSARLSFNFGGSGALVRRRSSSLGGLNAYGGRVDTAYRTTRRQSIGTGYVFQHYEFPGQFGASDVHGVMVMHSAELPQRWQFQWSVGGFRVESLFARRVALDPAIAAILGQGTGVEAFYGITYGLSGHASLTRSFRRSSTGLRYRRGVSPGNGYYLTSKREEADASYQYSGFRRAGVGFHGGYSSFSSLTRNLGMYRAATGGASASYRISGALHFTASFNARRMLAGITGFRRVSYGAHVGLTFAPGTLPLSLW